MVVSREMVLDLGTCARAQSMGRYQIIKNTLMKVVLPIVTLSCLVHHGLTYRE